MTRDEAIYTLNNTAWLGSRMDKVEKAVELATEALKNWEPVTHCKDCDRAQRVFNSLGEKVYMCKIYKPMMIHTSYDGRAFCSNGRQK